MKKVFTVCLLCVLQSAFSQDTSAKKNQIFFKPIIGWRMDGHRLSFKEFKQEIYNVPAAIPVFKKAKTNQIIGYSSFVSGVLFLIFGKEVTNINSPRFRKKNTGFQIAGIFFEGASLYFILHSHKQFKQAVRLHNQAY
jgi:hypothetical protein